MGRTGRRGFHHRWSERTLKVNKRRQDRDRTFLVGVTAAVLLVAGCASSPPPGSAPAVPAASAVAPLPAMHETPVPEGNWRECRLARCEPDPVLSRRVEELLASCSALFRDGSGSDAIVEMEMGLDQGLRHPLLLVTLGQLYNMAGQGEPGLMPNEGPAADVGDWKRNQKRLLGRARTLLGEALAERPDDAAIDYLLADAARTAGDLAQADSLAARGRTKCTGGRSFRALELYQQLNRYPAQYRGGAAPVYPPSAMARGLSGDVVLDLLLDPDARVRQVVAISSPGEALTAAGAAAVHGGEFTPARLGKYPVWSWLRVTFSFNLDG